MMKRLISLILIMLPIVSYAQAPIDELARLLGNIQTYQANFQQDVKDMQGEVIQHSTGHVDLQRPGKLRWHTQKPNNQIIIADGKKIWIYDVDLDQVSVKPVDQNCNFKTSISASQKACVTPIGLLTGDAATLLKNYEIKKKNNRFTLTQDDSKAPFQSVELSFDKALLTSMRLIDNLGQTTEILFSKSTLNKTLQAELFTFTPPEGVDVIS